MSCCVVVAMSGGVDSSVQGAALLREQGNEVIGVGLRFQDAAAKGTE